MLAAVLALSLWAAVPALFGWHPTTVMTGSMMPRIQVGDVAVSRPLHGRAPTLGSVLLFADPDHPGRLRFHRFVAVGTDGQLVTRGDANPADDSSHVSVSAVRGVGTLRIPHIGLPLVWIRTGQWVKVGLTVAVVIGLIALAGPGVRRRADPEDSNDPDEADEPETASDVDDDVHRDGAAPRTVDGPAGVDGGDSGDGAPAVDRDHSHGGNLRRWAGRRAHRLGPHPSPASRVSVGTRSVTAAGLALLMVGVVVAGTAPAESGFSSTTTSSATMSALPYFTCSAAVVASSPYLYYRMDETSPTTNKAATDSSGNNRTGVYNTSGETAQAARACNRDTGYAITFDGSSGYLSSPQNSSTSPNTFTLSIWFKTTTTRGGKLIGLGNSQTGLSGSYDRHLYLTNAGAVVFGVYPGTVKTISSATGLNDGVWHQAVATLSGAGMILYLDGVQVAANSTVTTAEQNSSGYWRIGYDNLSGWTNTPSSNYLNATLDDAAVYLTALNASSVKNLYLSGS